MFFSTIIHLELFIALFFLPGFFVTVILGIKQFRFLLSFALSYSFLVLTLLPFEYYTQPLLRWSAWIRWEWIVLAVVAVAKTFINPKSLSVSIRGLLSSRLCLPRLIVPLVLAGVICGYLAYAGPYLEVPSDAWNHLFWFQWQKLNVIDNGAVPSGLSWGSLLLHHTGFRYFNPWYFFHAWLCHISSLTIMDSIHVLTFVNTLVFSLGFYYFSLFLFAGLRISAIKKMMMAAFSSFFAAATTGFMVFAYIRYYAFAPAILSYVLFLAVMVIIIAWMRSNRWFGCAHHRWSGHVLWMAPILLIVTGLIHPQESLFIFFMTLALSIMGCFSLCWRKFIYGNLKDAAGPPACNAMRSIAGREAHALPTGFSDSGKGRAAVSLAYSAVVSLLATKAGPRRPNSFRTDGHYGRENRWTVSEWKSVILTVVLLVMFLAGFAAVRYFKPGAWISSNMIMPNVAIPSEPVNFIFRNLTISPPHNPWFRLAVYQLFIFYQVVGCWGLFVYLLFLLMVRKFVKLPYLTAGMIIVPFLTAFNPLSVDMMARMGQDMTIYRFFYMIPLPFVGGYLFVHFWCKAWEWFYKMRAAPKESVSPIWPRLSWVKFVGSFLIVAGLIGLVFPINTAGIHAPYSKIYTLRKIPAANDYHLCNDLGKIIAKYENKVILTDDWTVGILTYYSPKNTYSHVKWLNSLNPENEPPEPWTWESLRARGMVVVNRRDGAPSITGKIAKHWPEDVLKVSRCYSPEVQNYLESHPETFRKIWDQNRIAVYTVR